jgi:hypothetical protein
MTPFISHDRSEETLEAKGRWFQSLSLEERMDYFTDMMEFILEVNPQVAERKNRHARPLSGSFRVLELPRS